MGILSKIFGNRLWEKILKNTKFIRHKIKSKGVKLKDSNLDKFFKKLKDGNK